MTTSLCSPSRASILTGLYTFRHRVIDNQRAVPEGTLFFPQYLAKGGLQDRVSSASGTWGRANDEPRPGFRLLVQLQRPRAVLSAKRQYTINDNGKRVPQDGYITTLLTKKAIEFLEQQKDRSTNRSFCIYRTRPCTDPFTPEPKYKDSLAKTSLLSFRRRANC